MCGIVGVTGSKEASNLVYLGLYALQHRGQEAAGIVSSDGQKLYRMRRKGLVGDVFNEESFEYLKGHMSIGHVRYSTTGENNQRNVQPFVGTLQSGDLSIAHNGNLTNFIELKNTLMDEGAIFQSTMDTECILHLIAKERKSNIKDGLLSALPKLKGAFSLLLLTKNELIAVRDPWGFRPLCLGQMDDGAMILSSETTTFDLIRAKLIRELDPGELIIFDQHGKSKSYFIKNEVKRTSCVFEHVYFSRPDSNVFGKSVYHSRLNLGKELAKEHKLKADLVMPVPSSGTLAALGYASESNITYQMGFIRNHYVGRTFIEPSQSIRGFGVRLKLNPVSSVIKGKDIIVVDDSIVRGTTSKKIIKMLKDVGAKSVSLLISSPPFKHPCFYGIDTPSYEQLIASKMSVEEIRRYIEVDYLGFLSIEGLRRAVQYQDGFCEACFSGQYPT